MDPCEICGGLECRSEHVYFIRDDGDGLIKIGFTGNLIQRLRGISRESPLNKPATLLRLVGILPGGRDLERKVLRQFKPFKILGVHGDWHEPHPDLVSFIREKAFEPIRQIREERTELHATLKVYTMSALELRESALREVYLRSVLHVYATVPMHPPFFARGVLETGRETYCGIVTPERKELDDRIRAAFPGDEVGRI